MSQRSNYSKQPALGWISQIEDHLNSSGPEYLKSEDEHYKELTSLITQGREPFFRAYMLATASSKHRARKLLLSLSILSNKIYKCLILSNRIHKGSRKKDPRRKALLKTLDMAESLMQECREFDDTPNTALQMTSYRLAVKRSELKKSFAVLNGKLTENKIDIHLRSIILEELRSYIFKNILTEDKFKAIELFLHSLIATPQFEQGQIEVILFQHNFNSKLFFAYWTERCQSIILESAELHEQIETIIKLETMLIAQQGSTAVTGMFTGKSLHQNVGMYYRDQKTLIQQTILLRRSRIQDNVDQEETPHMMINLSVAQFGLLIRLFMENDLLPKNNIGRTFAYYARNFRTARTMYISAESLQKKSTDVEYATARKLKEYLINMLNWINRYYTPE